MGLSQFYIAMHKRLPDKWCKFLEIVCHLLLAYVVIESLRWVKFLGQV